MGPSLPERRLGLVVHPTRHVERVLEELGVWASAHGVEVGQVRVPGQTRRLADPVDASDCDLLVALGGDGTTLVALHAGARCSCPVLGVACGSIGALSSVGAHEVGWALDETSAGRWSPATLPALEVASDGARGATAINDIVMIRDGPGQVLVSISVDGDLYARVAGDGVVVATALGSSAYTMAAGGPLLAPGAEGMVVTPLEAHGGSRAPLVVGPRSRLELEVQPGYGGVRFELDGHRSPLPAGHLAIGLRPGYATLVTLADEEPRLAGLRRRGLVLDSPRWLVRDGRLPEPPAGD